MNQEQSPGLRARNEIQLAELSIVLVANSNNPSIINPDFLRYNKIVDADYEVQDAPVSTPAFSHVTFKNGISVVSDPTRVIFTQFGTLTEENVVSPGIAKRYLKCIPHVPYHAIGINPKGLQDGSGQASYSVAKMLRDSGSWASFRDVTPEVQLKTIYHYNERIITLDVASTERTENGKKISGTLFAANIHHELVEAHPESRINRLSSLLDSWENDLKDFYDLAGKFRGEG